MTKISKSQKERILQECNTNIQYYKDHLERIFITQEDYKKRIKDMEIMISILNNNVELIDE